MKELCVPIPNFGEDQIASILLRVGDEEIEYNFRVVSFPWEVDDELTKKDDEVHNSLAKIYRLKKAIESYDKEWEIMQIYTPLENAKYIQVLYRKRKRR
jgi:hypothetical protein